MIGIRSIPLDIIQSSNVAQIMFSPCYHSTISILMSWILLNPLNVESVNDLLSGVIDVGSEILPPFLTNPELIKLCSFTTVRNNSFFNIYVGAVNIYV